MKKIIKFYIIILSIFPFFSYAISGLNNDGSEPFPYNIFSPKTINILDFTIGIIIYIGIPFSIIYFFWGIIQLIFLKDKIQKNKGIHKVIYSILIFVVLAFIFAVWKALIA